MHIKPKLQIRIHLGTLAHLYLGGTIAWETTESLIWFTEIDHDLKECNSFIAVTFTFTLLKENR